VGLLVLKVIVITDSFTVVTMVILLGGAFVLKRCVVAESCIVVTMWVVLGGAFGAEGVCGGGQLYRSDYGGCVKLGF